MYCARAQKEILSQECMTTIVGTTDGAHFALCRACPEGQRIIGTVGTCMPDVPATPSPKEYTMSKDATFLSDTEKEDTLPQKSPQKLTRVPRPRKPVPATVPVAVVDLTTVPVEYLAREIRRRLPRAVILLSF